MQSMKFETIKRKAIDEFVTKVYPHLIGPHDDAVFLALVAQVEQFNATGVFRPAQKIREEWEAYGRKLITAWDVRSVGKLAELLPSCVPAHWRGRKLQAWMEDDEDSTWMVSPL